MSDTIPEAVELAAKFLTEYKGKPLVDYVTEACLAYHQRRLAECGDAKHTAQMIMGTFKAFKESGRDCIYDTDILELIQAHTAKAVEGQKKETYRLAKEWRGDVAKLEDERTTLKNQCEELRQFVTYWRERFEQMEKERDDLRTRAEKADSLAATHWASVTLLTEGNNNLQLALSYERDRAEKAEAELAKLKGKQ